MQPIKNIENPSALAATSHSVGDGRENRAHRSHPTSPSPAPIRRNRPLQNLTNLGSNEVSRRGFGDDKENHSMSDNSLRLHPSTVPKIDHTSVFLQPPTHSLHSSEVQSNQFAPQPLIPKPSLQTVHLGAISLPNQWNSVHNSNDPAHSGHTDGAQFHHNRMARSHYFRDEMESHEIDPFARLSARTLALMDQPESEVTIYDCEYCDKTYQGKHARSIWRRHLSDKHKIPLATQPRRTRWDNDANRPKTEEERRERTLESKRRWARKNRAAKKAARDGQKNAELAARPRYTEAILPRSHGPSPNRSRAPSPSLFAQPLGNINSNSAEFRSAAEQLARSQSLQFEPSGHAAAEIARGTSVPQPFPSYMSMAPRASLPLSNSLFNSTFSATHGAPPPEWSFPVLNSQISQPHSFGNYSSLSSGEHPVFQLSSHLTNDGTRENYPSRHPSDLAPGLTPLTAYPADHKLSSKHEELSDCHPSAEFSAPYGHWDLGNRLGFSQPLPGSVEQFDPMTHEFHSKRPRLSQSSFAPIVGPHFDEINQNSGAGQLDALQDTVDMRAIGDPNSSYDSTTGAVLQDSPVASVGDEEAETESNNAPEHDPSPQSSQQDFGATLNSPMHSENCDQEGNLIRPATAGTLSSFSHESETFATAPMERAATEPQLPMRPELQTPNARESGLRSFTKLHLANSPLRADTRLDSVDLLSSPAVSRPDPSMMSLYQGHFAPMSAGKRRATFNHSAQPLGPSSSLNTNDWSNPAPNTPGYSRFQFGGNLLNSPGGGAGAFGSPHSNLSKSLGLTINSASASEDVLLVLGNSSSWDLVYPKS